MKKIEYFIGLIVLMMALAGCKQQETITSSPLENESSEGMRQSLESTEVSKSSQTNTSIEIDKKSTTEDETSSQEEGLNLKASPSQATVHTKDTITATKENITVKEDLTVKGQESKKGNKEDKQEVRPVQSEQIASKQEKVEKVNTNVITKEKDEAEENIVTLSIYDDKGVILEPLEVVMNDGDTVFTVLQRTLKDKKIQMEYSGKEDTVYIEGINSLYEFDRGSGSGWMYSVNGIYPNKSCGAYSVSEGDNIEWRYTLDLGKDINATLSEETTK